MCLAVLIPKDSILSKEYAQNGFSNNREGAGFAYIEDGKVKIEKGFFDFEDFWKAFEAVQSKNSEAKLVHFRIATCGKVCAANCHPWKLNDSAALIHNGSFTEFQSDGERISDTGLFVERVLLPIFSKYKKPLPNKGLSWMMEKIILGQRVAVLYTTVNGMVGWMRFAPQLWTTVITPGGGPIYFSNDSFKNTSTSQFYLTYPESNPNKKRHTIYRVGKDRGKYHNKRRKHHKWRIKGEILALKPEEINKLTHDSGYKMKELEAQGKVEKCWDDEIQQEFILVGLPICGDCGQKHEITAPCNKQSVNYKRFWMNKPREVYSRDDFDYASDMSKSLK